MARTLPKRDQATAAKDFKRKLNGCAKDHQGHTEHGCGEAIADRKVMESAVTDMTAIAGQQPVICLARKSEAGFKIREGYSIRKVTLRSERMYDFIERLVDIAIPRIRDFRGLNPRPLMVAQLQHGYH